MKIFKFVSSILKDIGKFLLFILAMIFATIILSGILLGISYVLINVIVFTLKISIILGMVVGTIIAYLVGSLLCGEFTNPIENINNIIKYFKRKWNEIDEVENERN